MNANPSLQWVAWEGGGGVCLGDRRFVDTPLGDARYASLEWIAAIAMAVIRSTGDRACGREPRAPFARIAPESAGAARRDDRGWHNAERLMATAAEAIRSCPGARPGYLVDPGEETHCRVHAPSCSRGVQARSVPRLRNVSSARCLCVSQRIEGARETTHLEPVSARISSGCTHVVAGRHRAFQMARPVGWQLAPLEVRSPRSQPGDGTKPCVQPML